MSIRGETLSARRRCLATWMSGTDKGLAPRKINGASGSSTCKRTRRCCRPRNGSSDTTDSGLQHVASYGPRACKKLYLKLGHHPLSRPRSSAPRHMASPSFPNFCRRRRPRALERASSSVPKPRKLETHLIAAHATHPDRMLFWRFVPIMASIERSFAI